MITSRVMIYSTFLPRRLSQGGCVVAGTRVAAVRQKFKDEKLKLAAKPEAAVQKVIEKTRDLEALTSTDASMIEVDRGTDRAFAGFDDQLDAIERSFDNADVIALTEEQSARLADARLVRGTLLADGTSFLRLPYSQQWRRMSAVIKAMDGSDITAAIQRLGLTGEAARLRSWVTLYGSKLGVTEAKNPDAAAVAVDAWHEAYGELMVRVHDAYDDPADETHKRIRDALTSPYHLQAEEERRAEQKARAKRKTAEPNEG